MRLPARPTAGDQGSVPHRDRPAARRHRCHQGADRGRRPRAPGKARQDGPALVPPGPHRDPPQAPADRRAHRAHADAAGGPGKVGFKDCLIEVLRDEFDDEAWQGFLDRAHALHDQREAPDGAAAAAGEPHGRGDPRGVRDRRRRRLPRAPRRLGDRPGVRPGALVRVPLDHARRPGRAHAAPVRDRPARGGAADPQPAPDRGHRARRRSRHRPAVARPGAWRALRRQPRWRGARHARGAEDLARPRVQDPQREVVHRAQDSTGSARRSPSTGRRCRSTCI